MSEIYKTRTNKTQYVNISEAFHKIYLYLQVLLAIQVTLCRNNDKA